MVLTKQENQRRLYVDNKLLNVGIGRDHGFFCTYEGNYGL